MGAARDLPNVLLIVFDTARADVFEPYGAPAGSTPAVAGLAAGGTAHPRAYAPSSWTVPSHLGMFSGLLPRAAGMHLGVQVPPFFRDLIRHHGHRWLPAVLRDAGYRTIGLSANGWISAHSGFDLGFDRFEEIHNGRHTRLGATDIWSRARWAIDSLRADLDDGAKEIARLLGEELRPGRPFFCFVNLIECHSPYLPPKPFNSLGWRQRMAAARDANLYSTFGAMWQQAFGMMEVPAESLDRMRIQYVDSIRQLDSWLARVLTTLDDASLLGDTQVIVTSDHGENLGEGGLTGHSFSLDDRLVRIPFVTAGPLSFGAGPAMTLTQLPVMLAGALDLPGSPWEEVEPSPVAVAEFVAPGRRGDPDAVRNAATLPPHGAEMLFRDFQCATDGRWKILRGEEGETVLDLVADPLETAARAGGVGKLPGGAGADRTGPPPSELAALREALDRADRAVPESIEAAPAPGGPPAPVTDPLEAKALEDQMRLLGYM